MRRGSLLVVLAYSSRAASAAPFAALDRCREPCLACGDSPRRLYGEWSRWRSDGVGTMVKFVAQTMALAHNANRSFGGLAREPLPRSADSHGVLQWRVLDAVFGTGVVADPSLVEGLPLTEPAAAAGGPGNVYVRQTTYREWRRAPPLLRLRPAFVAKLRAGARCYLAAYRMRLAFDGARPSVAVHVRRGDVDGGQQNGHRFVTDECVLGTLDWIKAIAGPLDAHVFSSVVTNTRLMQKYKRTVWTPASFEPFRRWGAAVHLGTEGGVRGRVNNREPPPAATTDAVLASWAHFASADVFLAGSSTYSYVAAALNPGCVLRPSQKTGCYARTERAEACVKGLAAGRIGRL